MEMTYISGSQPFQAVTWGPPTLIITWNVAVEALHFPFQINIVKIADLQAHNASLCEPL